MEESVRIMCPKLTCRRMLSVPASSRGRVVRCKNCGTNIRVPGKPPATATPATPAKSKQSDAA